MSKQRKVKEEGKRKVNPIKEIIDYILLVRDDVSDESLAALYRAADSFLYLLFAKIPRALYLYNKWFNHIYDRYDSIESFKNFLDNLRIIVRNLRISHKDNIHVPKSNELQLKRDFYDLLDKLFDYPLNDIEKAYYYYLYSRYNLISDEEVKLLIGDTNKQKISADEIIKLLEEYNKQKFVTVKELEQYILNRKKNKFYCTGCPLENREKIVEDEKDVILDSNVENLGDIQILFIGINPGETEAKEGKPFVGKSGQLLREKISEVIESNNIGYAITNVILCPTHNQDELKDVVKKVVKQCKYRDDIISSLPNLKLIVLVGDIPKNAFGLKGRITQIAGAIQQYNPNTKITCIPHPSALLRQSKASINAWNNAWESIEKFIKSELDSTPKTSPQKQVNIDKVKQSHNSRKVTEINHISELPENQTLFDVQILEEQNKYLIIMIDKEGNKHYYTMPFKFIFYIHKQQLPQFCRYTEDINNLNMCIIDNYKELQKLKRIKSLDIEDLIKTCKV